MTAPNALDHVRPVFRRILVWAALLAVGLAVVGGVVGLLVAGTPGLVGGLLGAVLSVVFLGLTALSVLVALRVSKGQMISGAFFGIVMGTWLLKFVVFIVVHVGLVLATGARRNLNHMFWGSDDPHGWAGAVVFAASTAVIVGAWFAIRPFVMQRLGALFGSVGR